MTGLIRGDIRTPQPTKGRMKNLYRTLSVSLLLAAASATASARTATETA